VTPKSYHMERDWHLELHQDAGAFTLEMNEFLSKVKVEPQRAKRIVDSVVYLRMKSKEVGILLDEFRQSLKDGDAEATFENIIQALLEIDNLSESISPGRDELIGLTKELEAIEKKRNS